MAIIDVKPYRTTIANPLGWPTVEVEKVYRELGGDETAWRMLMRDPSVEQLLTPGDIDGEVLRWARALRRRSTARRRPGRHSLPRDCPYEIKAFRPT